MHSAMELWNKKDLSMPPNNSVKMKKTDIDITHLQSIFHSALKAMEEKHLLHREAALLSRYLYKQQRPLRGQKGLLCLYKINRGLKRYVSLDLQYVYRNFSKLLSCVDDDVYIYVPTKQMLQYVLVRTQGFCKVMHYLSVACEDGALYFRGIIRLGHNISRSVISLGMVSRIWFCTRYFMICACQWYKQLLPYLDELKIKGPCWLPTEYEFCENLGSWLGTDLVTGELKCDVDVQKISQEISKIKAFEDFGTVVSRADYLAQRKGKAGDLVDKSVITGFSEKNDLSLITDLNAELMIESTNTFSATRNTPLEICPNDLNEQICNEERETSVINKCLSPKSWKDAFCSSDASEVEGKKSSSKSHGKVIDINIKKQFMDNSLNCVQKIELVQSIQSENTLNNIKDITSKIEFKLNTGQVFEGQQQCVIKSEYKKEKKPLGNWEIINGIRTLKDVKEFLRSEKKARTKGKSCVTSQLNNSEWIVLFESIKKLLKKKNVSKLKGNKRLKAVMEEIRNILISFVI